MLMTETFEAIKAVDPNLHTGLYKICRKRGILPTDPRINTVLRELEELQKAVTEGNFEDFRGVAYHSFTFLHKIVFNHLVIEDMTSLYRKTKVLFQEVDEMETEGTLPSAIPQLADVDPAKFAVSICTVDGQRINLGDYQTRVTKQAISAITTFLIAQEELGEKDLL